MRVSNCVVRSAYHIWFVCFAVWEETVPFTVDILVSALSPKFLLLRKNFITDFYHVRCAYYRVRYYYLTIEVSNSPALKMCIPRTTLFNSVIILIDCPTQMPSTMTLTRICSCHGSAVLRIRIRDPVHFLTPVSGIRNSFFPDPGSQSHIFLSSVTIFG